MDVQRYISSGVIESYVAGLATDQEVRELQASMAQHPEIKAAVEAAWLDMERYVEMHAVQPPADVKTQIFGVLSNDTTEAAAVAASTAAEEQYEEAVKERRAVPAARKWQYAAAAIFIGLIASVCMNFVFLNRSTEWESRYQALLSDQQKLTAQHDVMQTRLEKSDTLLRMLQDPAVKVAKMGAVSRQHLNVQATVYWNPNSKQVLLAVNNLPQPAPDQQYQLWAIVKGVPVDAGVFEMGDAAKGFQKMKTIEGAQMFAVTLEKKGGSPTPTMTAMYVAGKVAG